MTRQPPATASRSVFILSTCRPSRLFSLCALGLVLTGVKTLAADAFIAEHLTLSSAIAQALRNNSDIQVDDLSVEVEREKIKAAQLALDPTLQGSYAYQWINTPQNAQSYVATGGGVGTSINPATPILGEPTVFEERNHIGKLSLSQKLPTGTTIELGTTMRVLDNTLNRRMPPGIFNPEWETFTGLTITQPLLRDYGVGANTVEIRIAKANAKIADLEWQARTAQVVSEVMKRYYDVVFTRENMKVQADGITLAEKLQGDTTKRSKEGMAATNDVLVAEAGVYQRREEAIAAETQYVERQNALQLLFKRSEDVINHGSRLIPVDPLVTHVPETNRYTLMNLALQNRYEVGQSKEAIEVRQAQTVLARNQSRPRLDLIASGGYHGLAGDFSSTYSKAFDSQGPEWSAGMQFSLPLNFDHLRATRRAAEDQETQAHILEEKARLQVVLEVDTVLGRLRADELRLAATHKGRQAAQQSAEGELKRLTEGVTTSYQVLQIQKDYSQARSRELAALADMNKDLVDLYLATGVLLDKQGITITSRIDGVKATIGDKNAMPVQSGVSPVKAEASAVPAVAPVSVDAAPQPAKYSLRKSLGRMFSRNSDAGAPAASA
ncbi:MAG: putative Outer rane efflux protein, partial [Verrucomicrobiaceae bacterium]|nr:putative Outer rane efflux protein [Verrucomicrobiaceae bacterium]